MSAPVYKHEPSTFELPAIEYRPAIPISLEISPKVTHSEYQSAADLPERAIPLRALPLRAFPLRAHFHRARVCTPACGPLYKDVHSSARASWDDNAAVSTTQGMKGVLYPRW